MRDEINPIIHVNCGGLVIILFFVFADLRPHKREEEKVCETETNTHPHPPSSPCVSQVRSPIVQDAVRSQSPDCV